jgi:hypothetical protein
MKDPQTSGLNIKYFGYCYILTHIHIAANHTETKLDFNMLSIDTYFNEDWYNKEMNDEFDIHRTVHRNIFL